MINTPVVSVIVPVYNRPSLLRRALISLEQQTFPQWECIIVDDGSTDTTLLVAQEFAKKDSRFHIQQNGHQGANKALNEGIYLASGVYISLLDSDDEYLPDHLEKRVSTLQDNPDIDILYGGMKIIGDEYVLDKYDLTKKISLYDPEVYVGGTFFGKREVFTSLNGFKDLSYAADSDFMVRAKEKFSSFRVTWPTYIYHREHSDSITKNLEKQGDPHLLH